MNQIDSREFFGSLGCSGATILAVVIIAAAWVIFSHLRLMACDSSFEGGGPDTEKCENFPWSLVE